MKRRYFLVSLAAMGLSVQVGRGQPQNLPVVGFLSSRSPDESATLVAAFRGGLTEAGFAEGQTVAIEYRWADNQYERLPALATDLVARRVSVIVAAGGPASAFAAKDITNTIPIVFTSVGNPVEIGLVASLNRPGGNVTGTDATLTTEIDTKRLELLHELVPGVRAFAVLVNPKRPGSEHQTREIQIAARNLGVDVEIIPAGQEPEIDAAFDQISKAGLKALLVSSDPFFVSRREQLIALADRYAIPAFYQWREFVVAGGLMSYGASLADAYRQAGEYTGRILKGAKPSDLPVARPTRFELLINMNTAKALGIVIPPAILARAEIIE